MTAITSSNNNSDISFNKDMLLKIPSASTFGKSILEINEPFVGDELIPLEVALAVFEDDVPQSRLPVFTDMTSVVTPDPVDGTTHVYKNDTNDGDEFTEETFSTVSALSFDQSFIYDDGNNGDDDEDEDDFDMDEEIRKLTFEDDDDENTKSSEWSFDLSFLLDKPQTQPIEPIAVETMSNQVIDMTATEDDENDTKDLVHEQLKIETAPPVSPIHNDVDENVNMEIDDELKFFGSLAKEIMYAMDITVDNCHDENETIDLTNDDDNDNQAMPSLKKVATDFLAEPLEDVSLPNHLVVSPTSSSLSQESSTNRVMEVVGVCRDYVTFLDEQQSLP